MNKNDIMMYLGVCIAGILTLWFAKSILFGQDDLVEGLSNKGNSKVSSLTGSNLKNTLKRVKTELNMIEDTAGISKYRSDYEDLITDAEKIAQISVLETLSAIMKSPGGRTSKETVELIHQANEYSKLATVTLPAAMSFIDNYSSSSGNDSDDDWW
jgi:hypothetical protein